MGAVDYNSYTRTFDIAGTPIDWRRYSRITPFAHALFGITHLNAFAAGDSIVQTNFSMAFGGGVDFAVTKHIAVRAGRLDDLMTRFPSMNSTTGNLTVADRQSSLRFSSGVLLRFGRRD